MATPQTGSDWYMAGLIFGWEARMCPAEAPGPVAPQFAAQFLQGAEDAAQLRDAEEPAQEPNDGPAIGPLPEGTMTLEEYEEPTRQLLESLFHQHMPHTELPEYEQWYTPFDDVPVPVE